MEFEWDNDKAIANERKHGVSFHEAATVFADPLGAIYPDPDHSGDEERELLLGASDRGRLLMVVFTVRPPNVRIISARAATAGERTQFEASIPRELGDE